MGDHNPQTDHSLDPRLHEILHHTASGLVVGAVGGVIWHGLRGALNASKGLRLNGALAGIKMGAPTMAGNSAAWSGLLATFNCVAVAVRKKEDPWNWIMAGAGTEGCLAVRGGARSMLTGAIGGAFAMGIFEGIGALLNSEFFKVDRPVVPPLPSTSNSS